MTSAPVPPTSAPIKSLLRGRAFYESIGSPKFVVAPMVDQSEFAWRMLTRSFLTPEENSRMLAYTPMFHARLFGDAANAKYRDQHLQTSVTADLEPVLPTTPEVAAETKPYLDGNPTFDRPLFVQFCANDPDHLLSAAKLAAPYCDAIDLNLGCPQGIARKGHYGAFLQEDQELVHRLIRTLHEGDLGVPVTAKIRILGTKADTLRYAQNVLSAGASIITVHGRRREQKGHLTGVADWDYIRHLRDNLPPETVIFANGNILEHGDVERCLAATGADAVMSAEGNLSDPAIFARPPPVGQEGREYWRGACGSGSGDDGEAAAVVGGYRVDAVFRRYMDIMHRHVLGQEPPARRPLFVVGDDEAWLDETAGAETAGEEGPAKKKRKTDGNNNNKSSNQSSKNNKAAANSNKQRTTSPNLGAMRPHLFHLLRHFVALHTDIRDSLARCRAGDVDAAEAVLDLVERRVARGLIDYERTGGESIRSYMQSTSKPAKPDPVAAAATAAVAAAVDAVPNDDNGVSNNTTKETNGTTTTNTDGTSSARQEQLPPPPPAHEAEGESSLETVRACKRPWWVCQPIVRPLPAEALAKGSIQLSKKQQKALSSTAATTPVASTAPAAAAAAALDTVANTLPKTDGVDSIAEPRMDPKQPGLVSDDLVCG